MFVCTTEPLACLRQSPLNNNRLLPDRLERRLSQADSARRDVLGPADVQNENMILIMVDQLVKRGYHFGVAALAETALEDR